MRSSLGRWTPALIVALVVTLGWRLLEGPPPDKERANMPVPWLKDGDRVCLIGGATAERMQHHGWLETLLRWRQPAADVTFRNLGFSADELDVRQRTEGFDTLETSLALVDASVVLLLHGFNESFGGPESRLQFEENLAGFVRKLQHSLTSEGSPRRVVLVTPTPYEERSEFEFCAPREKNRGLRHSVDAVKQVGKRLSVPVVDLFAEMTVIMRGSASPLTINGYHLRDDGNFHAAQSILNALHIPQGRPWAADQGRSLRQAVLEKNQLWYQRFRATDGYNVYGGRSSLTYDGVTNFDVLQREMAILEALTAREDQRIAAIATGLPAKRELPVPAPIPVATNFPGTQPDGSHPFLSGSNAIAQMTVAAGFQVELVAEEDRFPLLANPVQMAFDGRGRLWVATWPSYPHARAGDPLEDKLLILEDQDGDGQADVCKVFADNLHNPTGFEFWNDGVFVACAPDLLFLKDTNGDDRADHQERVLHGLSSADTHHAANSFVWGPDGWLYFQEGVFHRSQIETVHGPQRNRDACVWRFHPRTWQVERHIAYGFANPHGHVFDRWGQEFVTDGTGNVNYYALPLSGRVIHPDKHRSTAPFFQQRTRPCAATEIVSSQHFGPDWEGDYLVANVIGFQGILRYDVRDDGSGFAADEGEPLVFSEDPNFRPSDIEVGPDGAVYFLDWSNPIIGHMQHHLRDPNRDQVHGRVYRVRRTDRELPASTSIESLSVTELLDHLRHPENRVRARARTELSKHDSSSVAAAVESWWPLQQHVEDAEHGLLEAFWVLQQHRSVDPELFAHLLNSEDARVRAAATRGLRDHGSVLRESDDWLVRMAQDPHPRVRLEAVVVASHGEDLAAIDTVLHAWSRPRDRFLDYAIEEALRTLDRVWKPMLKRGQRFSVGTETAMSCLVPRLTEDELLEIPGHPTVWRAILAHPRVSESARWENARRIARSNGGAVAGVLRDAIVEQDGKENSHRGHLLEQFGRMFHHEWKRTELPTKELEPLVQGEHPTTRAIGMAALARREGNLTRVWQRFQDQPHLLEALLRATRYLPTAFDRTPLTTLVRPILEQSETLQRRPGAHASYFPERFSSAQPPSFASRTAQWEGLVSGITLDIPPDDKAEAFGVLFEGAFRCPEAGAYEFFLTSDDGSVLNISGNTVVDNDGDHGMVERSGRIELSAGLHDFQLGFYEQGGDEGLALEWKGPGFPRRPLRSDDLVIVRQDPLRRAALQALCHVPESIDESLELILPLVRRGELLMEVSALLHELPTANASPETLGRLVQAIVGQVESQSELQRTTPETSLLLEAGLRCGATLTGEFSSDRVVRMKQLLGSQVVIGTIPHEMRYDRRELSVEAGQPVELTFQNNDAMPHNLVITRPDTMERVGMAAEELSGDTSETRNAFVPDLPEVLWATDLLLPGEAETLRFTAPREPGDYPFVCTFPGHWRVMNGTMRVMPEGQGRSSDSFPATTAGAPARSFIKLWTEEDFADRWVPGWQESASPKRGATVYEQAGCQKCHWRDGQGASTGPNLDSIADKYRGPMLLRQLLDPSSAILEGYENEVLFLKSGRQVVGCVVAEDSQTVTVLPNLREPEVREVVAKDLIRNRKKSSLSAMPTGLLVTFPEQDIVDLVRYLEIAGNSSHSRDSK